VLTVFTQDEREREYYELRLKYQRDQTSLVLDAKDQGRAEGLAEGIEKGTVIGEIRGFQRLLQQPQTPKEELAALSLKDLANLLAQLNKQLLPNGD
jgi:hypothetical protein